MTREDDLSSCRALGVEYVGFNFFSGSKRFVTAERAAAIWQKSSPPPVPVGLAVNASLEELSAIKRIFPELAIWQLHGDESASYVSDLRALFPEMKVWKALRVNTAEDAAGAREYADCELVLFDALVEPRTKSEKIEWGGTGHQFDWSILEAVPPGRPFGLAGGIKTEDLSHLPPKERLSFGRHLLRC